MLAAAAASQPDLEDCPRFSVRLDSCWLGRKMQWNDIVGTEPEHRAKSLSVTHLHGNIVTCPLQPYPATLLNRG